MVMEQEINYYSDGYKLWARLELPPDYKKGERRPALVECPGFRHGAADPKAMSGDFKGTYTVNELLLKAGYIILSPHCRGFGKSQGRPGFAEAPHTRLNPFEQVEDMRNAITWLAQRPEVDANQIGVFGYSYGGALAPYVAAVDHRVKACAGALGVGNGERWMRSLRRDWEYQEFRQRVEADLRQQTLTGKPEYVNPLDIMVPDPDSAKRGGALADTPIGKMRFTLDSAQYIMQFHPAEVAHKIACPVMLIGAEKDTLCPVGDYRTVYDAAPEPKEWVLIPGATHYGTYAPEHVEQLAKPIVRWFSRWMPTK
ncbi:MAG: alpha/beta fold hydrolase [Dehalococcoidia bacterium]|nr:alpha/beta fold hydrolase [Dehalococcoidia bacterium]